MMMVAGLVFYDAGSASNKEKSALYAREQELAARFRAVYGTVVCRELTKRYEQYLRGPLSQVKAELAAQGARGEFVILIAGAEPVSGSEAGADGDYASLVRELMDQGVDKKEAVRIVAKRCGVPKRAVYQAALTLS